MLTLRRASHAPSRALVPHEVRSTRPSLRRAWPLGALAALAALHAGASPADAQTVDVEGTLHTLWFDALRPGPASEPAHVLVTRDGRAYLLRSPVGRDAPAGGAGPGVGAAVRVTGRVSPVASGAMTEVVGAVVTPVQAAERVIGATPRAAATTRAEPYVTLLCKYADVPDEPRSRADYEALLLGAEYPALPHFWTTITDGRVSLAGSRVAGWFTLPRPYSFYHTPRSDGGVPDRENIRWDVLTEDCLSAADPAVDFTQFRGVNLQFNKPWALATGGTWNIRRDGTGILGMTWNPSNGSAFVYAHEMGHAFGLPHSGTTYTPEPLTRWDVMIGGRFYDPAVQQEVGGGTITDQHLRLGTISAEELVIPEPGTRLTLDLVRLNGPRGGVVALKLPLPGRVYYTVEARRRAGPYDRWLPQDGVLIYRVDSTRTPGEDWRPARLVDADNNGDPNDGGAVWTPGETFADEAIGYQVQVLAETPTGYRVSVRRGWAVVATVRGAGRVTVNGAPCTATPCEYIAPALGTTVTLVATPTDDASFLGWDGACTGPSLACTVALTRDMEVTARFGQPITITHAALREAVAGLPYADTLRAEGGVDGIRWELASGALPEGLTLSPTTGVIAGTPSAVGAFTFGVRARSDVLEATAEASLTIEPRLVIASESTRPGALAGAPYADTLRADGDAGTWEIADGTLPPGVSLASTGVLTGTPTAAGTFTATLSVSFGTQRAEQAFTWTVHTLTVDGLLAHLTGRQQMADGAVGALDRLGNHNGRLDVGDIAAWLDAVRPPAADAAVLRAATNR